MKNDITKNAISTIFENIFCYFPLPMMHCDHAFFTQNILHLNSSEGIFKQKFQSKAANVFTTKETC